MADPKEKKVKVKVLKYVGEFIPGQVIEVSEGYAKQLCKVSKVQDGERLVDNVRAMLLEEAEKLEVAEIADVSKMTAADMARLGLKNIVETPVDPELKANMAAGKDTITGLEKAKAKPGPKGKGKGQKAEEPPAPPAEPPVEPPKEP